MIPPQDDPSPSDYVDVTIVGFAAHTAYLDPETGTGYLVAPRPETDVAALQDPLVEAAWSAQLGDLGATPPLSLHAADRRRALSRLEQMGWCLLRDEGGAVERAGRTADGRLALCLYGPSTVEQPTLDALDRAVIALDIAAGVDLGPDRHDDGTVVGWD